MALIRITNVSLLQSLIEWIVVKHKKRLTILREETSKGNETHSYVIDSNTVAEERKLTPAMTKVGWTRRVKSDKCYVEHDVFRLMCLDSDWASLSTEERHRQYNKAVHKLDYDRTQTLLRSSRE